MHFNNSNYKKYHSKNYLKQVMIKKFKNKLIKILNNDNDNNNLTTLLDAGCGEGFISDFIYNNTKIKNITGIDICSNSINYAKKQNEMIKYECKNLYKLDYINNSFDVVISLEVLEHLEKPEIVLKELIRISKKKLIISVPNEPFFSLGNLLSFKNVKTLGNPIDHVNKWTKNKFIKFIKQNGVTNFSVVTSFPWTIVIII